MAATDAQAVMVAARRRAKSAQDIPVRISSIGGTAQKPSTRRRKNWIDLVKALKVKRVPKKVKKLKISKRLA